MADADGTVFISYASFYTGKHLATATIEKLKDYVVNTPEGAEQTKQHSRKRTRLIDFYLEISKNGTSSYSMKVSNAFPRKSREGQARSENPESKSG